MMMMMMMTVEKYYNKNNDKTNNITTTRTRTSRRYCRPSYNYCHNFIIRRFTTILVLLLLLAPWSSVRSFVPVVPPLVRVSNIESNNVTIRRRTPSSSFIAAAKDWDNLVDLDDDDDTDDYESTIPVDMKYVPRNVQRQFHHFLDIREVGGPELTNDVYARETQCSPQQFWFVGKVARISDVTVEQCVQKQYPLIVAHASQLRPIELFPARRELELWVAPGDSEMNVAYNRPSVIFTRIDRPVAGNIPKIKNNMIGFQGEIYERGEEGFRTWRTDDGRSLKPEVQGPETGSSSNSDDEQQEQQYRAPTDQEMHEIEKALEGKDLNELYEEQERRKKEDQR